MKIIKYLINKKLLLLIILLIFFNSIVFLTGGIFFQFNNSVLIYYLVVITIFFIFNITLIFLMRSIHWLYCFFIPVLVSLSYFCEMLYIHLKYIPPFNLRLGFEDSGDFWWYVKISQDIALLSLVIVILTLLIYQLIDFIKKKKSKESV